MANKRIFYAVHQVGIKEDGGSYTFGSGDEVHGVQSVGMSANFNLIKVFELGQISIYENVEEIPDTEATLSKCLDGYPLMYHMATQTASLPTLVGRSNEKCMFGLAIFPDTSESATGTPPSVVACSGMFVNSISYRFNITDNFDESVTLVGNNRVWKGQSGYGQTLATLPSPAFTGQFSGNNDVPLATTGVQRRENLLWAYAPASGLDVNGQVADPDATILPPEVFGISNSGTNELVDDVYGAHVSSITVSTDLGRESINELGRKSPYHRNVKFPVDVTCEIEVTSSSGDMISGIESGIYTTGVGNCVDGGNLANRTIRISVCEGTRIYLGTKNKLASVNYSGGDAGGSNVAVRYSFQTSNDFTVIHPQDPNSNAASWQANKGTYLVDLV